MTELERVTTPDTVVAGTVSHFAETGVVIPPSWKAIIGRHSKDLLAGGFDGETVALSAVLAVKRGSPKLMQYIAGDIMLARTGQHLDRSQYERQLQDFREVTNGSTG